MRTGSSVLVLLLSVLILAAVPEPIVSSVNQTGPTSWSPFGPRTKNLVMTVYGDFQTMFDAFVNGDIDITDWSVNPSDEVAFANNPDFFLTSGQDEFGIFEMDINHHNSFMGKAIQEPRGQDSFNSPSTKQPAAAGIQIRRALAHLLDKPNFVNGVPLGGRAKYVDVQAPPAQGLLVNASTQPSQFVGTQAQAEIDRDLLDHPWALGQGIAHEVSAYNLQSDQIGGYSIWWGLNGIFANLGYPGVADLRAACDHLALSGFQITPTDATCADVANASVGTSPPSGFYPHLVPTGQVSLILRTHPPRKAFGIIVGDSLDFLFGTPNGESPDCAVLYTFMQSFTNCKPLIYYTASQIADGVFGTRVEDDWHLYTGGWFLGSISDHLYSLYHSQFASSVCGGKRSSFAQNYEFYCSPAFDEQAAAGQFASSLSAANVAFSNAAVIAHRDVMTIPVYSGASQKFVALNGWNFQPGTESSLVSRLGLGFQLGFWSLLNMRQKPGYVPVDARYAPGGGDPELIRASVTHEVQHLSPFYATTIWDFEVLSTVYDSMLITNPLTGGASQQLIDWMTVKHSSSFDSGAGVTTQMWALRNDLKWHDGVPLTSADVVYSILAYRDVPSVNLQPSVATVLSATAVDSRTIQVRLSQQSPFYELNIGGLPIIPKHIWAPLCGDPPSQTSVCADPSFDPMSAGIYVGSGPWVCKNVNTGLVGGSCTRTGSGAVGGQEMIQGGKVILTRNDGYMRAVAPESSLHKFSWADRNNDGSVDILDIADVAFHFGAPDPYWNTAQNPLAPQTVGSDPTKVDIAEVATVAFYYDHGLTKPYAPSALTGLDPDLDPFF